MAKLRGKAKEAFLRKMAAGRRKAGGTKRHRNPIGRSPTGKLSKSAAKKIAKGHGGGARASVARKQGKAIAAARAQAHAATAEAAVAKKEAKKAVSEANAAKAAAQKAEKKTMAAKKKGGAKKGTKKRGGGARKHRAVKMHEAAQRAHRRRSGGGRRRSKRKLRPIHQRKGVHWRSKRARKGSGTAVRNENKRRRAINRRGNPTLSWSQLGVGALIGGITFAAAALLDRYVATMGTKDHPDALNGSQATDAIMARPGAMRLGVQAGAAGVSGVAAYMLRRHRWGATIFTSMALGFGGFLAYQLIMTQGLPRLLGYDKDTDLGSRLLPDQKPADQDALVAKVDKLLGPATVGTSGAPRRPFGVAGTPAAHVCNGNCDKTKQCATCARKIGIPEGHRAEKKIGPTGNVIYEMVPLGVGAPPARPAPAPAPQAAPPAAPAPRNEPVPLPSNVEDITNARLAMMGGRR